MTKQRTIYAFMTAAGLIGLGASFLETIEYQEMLKNMHAQLVCNINSVFSCSSVLNSWQSKIFGFPNSMLCMIFFTLMFSSGLVGLTGGELPVKLRLWLQGITIFFLGFALWFMWESTFHVRALCILCLFCFTGLLTLNWAWVRLNVNDLPFNSRTRLNIKRSFQNGGDIFSWLLLAIVVGSLMFFQFT